MLQNLTHIQLYMYQHNRAKFIPAAPVRKQNTLYALTSEPPGSEVSLRLVYILLLLPCYFLPVRRGLYPGAKVLPRLRISHLFSHAANVGTRCKLFYKKYCKIILQVGTRCLHLCRTVQKNNGTHSTNGQ